MGLGLLWQLRCRGQGWGLQTRDQAPGGANEPRCGVVATESPFMSIVRAFGRRDRAGRPKPGRLPVAAVTRLCPRSASIQGDRQIRALLPAFAWAPRGFDLFERKERAEALVGDFPGTALQDGLTLEVGEHGLSSYRQRIGDGRFGQ